MQTKHLLVAACAATLGFSSAFAGGDGWTHDFAAAKKQAADEKKDLLIDFTGSDWCGWCIKLQAEVFTHDSFKTGVKDKFVLVELDYPKKPENVAKLSDVIKAQNEDLRNKYSIQGYPTILLCDAEGKPFAKTGYQPGGPEKYVTHLDELRARKDSRDKSLAEAAKLEGPAKSKALIAALDAMELEDSTVANCYPDLIDQIKASDPKDKTGFVKKLAAKAKFDEFQSGVSALVGKQDMAGALVLVDQTAASGEFDGEALQKIMFTKAMLLSRIQKFDEAIQSLDEAKAAAPESQTASMLDAFKTRLEKVKAEAAAKGAEKPAEADR